MSWSVSYLGRPAKIVEALVAESSRLEGQSKAEFDEALPHMTALLNMNFTLENSFGRVEPQIRFTANGHGSVGADNKKLSSVFQMKIEHDYVNLV